MTFLGHVVSEAGIAMDPKKLEAVRDWPTPKNLKKREVSSDSVRTTENSSDRSVKLRGPLHALTRKNEPFVWSELCQTALMN